MTNEDVKLIAKAVKRAAEIRTNSWIHEDPNSDEFGHYGIDMEDAEQQAVKEVGLPEPMWYVLHLAFHWLGDLLAWAEAIESNKMKEFFYSEESILEESK